MRLFLCICIFFFFSGPSTTAIYTLSLHDALPICFCSGLEHAPIATTATTIARRFMQTPDRKSTRLNSSHMSISYAVFCLKKKKKKKIINHMPTAQRVMVDLQYQPRPLLTKSTDNI